MREKQARGLKIPGPGASKLPGDARQGKI